MLKQVTPEVAALLNELPNVDRQNKENRGDVLFAGQPTGEFNGFDAATGRLLWQFQTGSGIHSSPMTYSVKGKQYVAVPAGWGGWIKGFSPELIGSPRGDALFVFALP